MLKKNQQQTNKPKQQQNKTPRRKWEGKRSM